LPTFEVVLACPAFREDLRRHAKRHPELKARVINKLDHVLLNPYELGRRLQQAPPCFKVRIGADFRLIYHLRDYDLIPVMLYAKNEHEDVVLRDVLKALDSITRRAGEGL
jgi:mRNA-degrading endonuclease RelE of RelBE toxin-antitoxin system